MSIPLPPLPHPVMNTALGDDWADLFTENQLRARDQEIVRCVLEAVLQAARPPSIDPASWYQMEVEMLDRIRSLEFHHE